MPLEVSPTCGSHGYEFGAVGGNALGKEAGDEKVDEEVRKDEIIFFHKVRKLEDSNPNNKLLGKCLKQTCFIFPSCSEL